MMRIQKPLSFFLLVWLIYYSFIGLMPQKSKSMLISDISFSTERALMPLKEISKAPHFIGNNEHARVREYLMDQLRGLDLKPETQSEFVYRDNGNLSRPINILARIKGKQSGNSLLVLSHYDSAMTSSNGASDAGSGVATILESIRAFKASGKQPKNDIIILFTDGEEIGLDGANLFVSKHPWAEDVKLALNFEARGSGGVSNMIIETNQGNHNIIEGVISAKVKYPVTSSLMYSVYKLLPNYTDSTILREKGDIDGLLFAFIDKHYNYHTINDNFENLSRNSIQHQGSYLLPLMHYFANIDLSNIKSDQDDVYFNFPFVKIISYPSFFAQPLLILTIAVFVILVFFGLRKGKMKLKEILQGFLAFFLSLFICFILGFYGWPLLLKLYPQYYEIRHGFTYNGYDYIVFFVSLSLAITFMVYRKFKLTNISSLCVAPIFFWLIINIILFIFLKGATYFIIPILFSLLSLGLLVYMERPNLLIILILKIPAIFIFCPLIQVFPVSLGLNALSVSCVFTVLIFGLLLSVIGSYSYKKIFPFLFLVTALIFFVIAHSKSSYSEVRQRPNSLVYYQDVDKQKSYWITYDTDLDEWTKYYLSDSPEKAEKHAVNLSKIQIETHYSYINEAEHISLPRCNIRIERDTLVGDIQEVTFTILPRRDVHILKLSINQDVCFDSLAFNGINISTNSMRKTLRRKENKFLLHYNVSENDSLEVRYSINKESDLKFNVLEYSIDLLENTILSVKRRPKYTMPKPFAITDAVIVKSSFKIDSILSLEKD